MNLLSEISKLGQPKPGGYGYMVNCPCHEDDKASLSLWVDANSGKLCWNCMAGCEHSAVGAALSSLEIPTQFTTPAVEYVYRDESGNELYRKVRKTGKEFYFSGDTKTRRVLYNTDKLPGHEGPVIIVEGEKDVDRLGELGFLAVTNDDGAGKFKQAYAEQLRDRDCIIIPDYDEPGRKHANLVKQYLDGVSSSVTILDMDELFRLINVIPWKGFDISDWLDRGGNKELLEAQVPTLGPSLALKTQEAFKDTIAAIERRYHQEGEIWGLESGFTPLDEITGGFQPSDLIVIAARPSMGKTALALNIAENIMHEHRVLIFSLEMSREALLTRLICSMAGISSSRIRAKDLERPDFQALEEAASRGVHSKLLIDDTSGITIDSIRALAVRQHRVSPLSLVIVDYIQRVRSVDFRADKRREVGEASEGLKTLAKELNIPVIALAQLNRGIDSRNSQRRKDVAPRAPVLSDLKESGDIEQDADLIAFLWQHDGFQGCRELTITKHRNGPLGNIRFSFDAPLTKFTIWEQYRPPVIEPDIETLGLI